MMNRLKIVLVLMLAITACNETKVKIPPPAPIEKEKSLENIRLTDLNAQPINLAQYKGKVLFLNIWATWCKPCIEEIPSIEKAQSILQDSNIVFLLASGEEAVQITEFNASNPHKLNNARIENMEALNIRALPTTFIFDATGILAFSEIGFRKWDDEENLNAIRKILNK